MGVLKVLTVVMGLLIVAGTAVLAVAVARRFGAAPPASVALTLDEPDGTRIVGIAATADRLAVHLRGGGPDRILLIDPRSGVSAGRIALAH